MAERFREAMQRTFLVVADAIYSTETAQFADVFLPSAMWVEKGGVFSQSERRYHLVPKLVDPPGEARSDLEILIKLAIAGLICLLIFLLSGFAAWSVGIGIFLGMPLLLVAVVLYVLVVIRDLRRRGAL